MGANAVQLLEQLASPSETLDQLFRRVHERESWENGHGGYTGSFAEIPGVVALTQTAMPRPMARLVVEQLLDYQDAPLAPELAARLQRVVRPQKWEAGIAIPVMDDAKLITKERLVTVTHTLTDLHGEEWRALLAAKLGLDASHTWLQTYKVESDTLTSRVATVRAAGPRVVRFGLVAPHRHLGLTLSEALAAIDEPSEAKALAAGKALLATLDLSDPRYAGLKLQVQARVRRDDGLGSLTVETRKRVTKVRATLQHAKVTTGPTVAWLLAGVASS